MLKQIVYWLIFIAVITQVVSCIFGGSIFMPEEFPGAPHSW